MIIVTTKHNANAASPIATLCVNRMRSTLQVKQIRWKPFNKTRLSNSLARQDPDS